MTSLGLFRVISPRANFFTESLCYEMRFWCSSLFSFSFDPSFSNLSIVGLPTLWNTTSKSAGINVNKLFLKNRFWSRCPAVSKQSTSPPLPLFKIFSFDEQPQNPGLHAAPLKLEWIYSEDSLWSAGFRVGGGRQSFSATSRVCYSPACLLFQLYHAVLCTRCLTERAFNLEKLSFEDEIY